MSTGLAEYLRRGAHDDGGEGYQRVTQRNGSMIERPLSNSATSTFGGTANATTGGGVGTNADGTASSAFLSANAGTGNFARITDVIYGRVLGIRVVRDTSVATAPFTVVCDGVPYYVTEVKNRRNSSLGSMTETATLILDRDLPHDGPHTVDIVLNADVTGGANRQVIIAGWVTDSSQGHANRVRAGWLGSSGVVLTAAYQSCVSFGPVRKLCFSNNDTVAHSVTIKIGAKFRDVLVPAAATAPAADGYAEHDFGQPIGAWGSIQALVDAGGTAGKVTMWTQQGEVK